MYLTISIASVALILLILYLGNLKFELKINKEKQPYSNTLSTLGNAELSVLKLLSSGKTNQEIADKLCISIHTVKKHVSNIFKKLDINSRSEARKFKNLLDA